MATAKYTSITLPHMGINEDGPPGSLDANESPQMVNVLLHNPSEIKRRGGFNHKAIYAAQNTDEIPVGCAVHLGTALITYMANDSGGDQWFSDYFDWSRLGPATFVGGNYPEIIGMYWDGSTPTAVASSGYTNDISGTPDANILMPLGKQCVYEGVVYYPSLGSEETYAKDGSTPSLIDAPRLVAWAGRNQAVDTHTTDVDATVGSTTITFNSDPGDITGTFLTFDGDRTTTVPYSYLVAERLSTVDFRLAKPYGLGESAAASKTNQTAVTRSRDIHIESPAGIACCAAHLDRIFTGRAWVRDAVGDVQEGYYYNALKWSKTLNPEKWPDQNIILVGGSSNTPNDMIMGLAPVGRYLLIFKQYSTWVLSGDSEDNFAVRQIIGEYGCIDSRSIVEYNDNIIWASHKGIHMISPDLAATDLTQRKPGHGIRSMQFPRSGK